VGGLSSFFALMSQPRNLTTKMNRTGRHAPLTKDQELLSEIRDLLRRGLPASE